MIFSKTIIAIAAIAAITAFGIQAHERSDFPMRAMFKKLDLSEQQKQDVRTIMQQSKEDRKIYQQDLRDIEQQLKSLIRSTSWEQDKVTALLERKQMIRSETDLASATKRNAVWNALDPDQQQKLIAMSEKGSERKGKKEKAGDKKDKRHSPMKMFKRLDLSEEQSAKIKALFEQQKASMKAQRETIKGFRDQTMSIVRSADFDQSAWTAVNQEMSSAHLQMAADMAYVRHQIWNILDAEQQAKMAKMDDKRKHRKGGDKQRKGKDKRHHGDDR